MRSVMMLNASNEALSFITWQRAVALVAIEVAEIVEAFPDKVIRSQNLSIPLPKVIRLREYVYVKYQGNADRSLPTKQNVLARDSSTCIYCGQMATTVDHILPKSRGGLDTWENLAGACFPCNNMKDDRTPFEAGMKLLWEPYKFSNQKMKQRRLRELGIS
jgi:5-methylcytosine-specific restriction endonuclease McrA